jgi:hypothetical protein
VSVAPEVAGALIGGATSLVVAAVTWTVAVKTTRTYREDRSISVAPGLFEARITHYGSLWQLTDVGPEPTDHSGQYTPYDNSALTAAAMRRWYYENGAGLLLSDDSQALWAKICARLENEPPVERMAVWSAMSLLRTELKLDLQVRDERAKARGTKRATASDDLERLRELRKRSGDVVGTGFAWPPPET